MLMPKASTKLTLLICSLLIILNVGIFFYANTIPITWTQDEFFNYGFFWSMDAGNEFTLHTGFKKEDFSKIFMVKYIDEVFRTRQFYTLFEMFWFKFWQLQEDVLFKNYTLIGLHITNGILLGMIVLFLTKNKRAVILSFLLVLNSGICLATLLFPFRSAKLLAMSLFLLGWLAFILSSGQLRNSLSLR